ncbi:MAG: hypothetical protein KAU36_07865 [candidate division Zixibacteria bacterium]|nr:hypothetical protein [candidate division Zixibacteria bacterium]
MPKFWLSQLAILLIAGSLMAQDGDVKPDDAVPPADEAKVYLLVDEQNPHPDGFLGQVAFDGSFNYASISTDPTRSTDDIQRYHFGLNVVAASRLVLMTSFTAVKQDTAFYEFEGGFRFYTKDPANRAIGHNPDGPIGGPVLTVMAGTRYSGSSEPKNTAIADFCLSLPISRQLTIWGGYRYYETLTETDVDQGFGCISYYTRPYVKDSAYANPDGPVGNLALKLSGGGSSEGVFGQLALIFPISGTMSLVAVGRGERVEFPYQRSITAGAAFRIYPSNY